ncbi:MAG: agmatine deiminase family protein [Bacteroidetes bacterium]|nr:agmatine deiminase family protein [Bacteroidota bacterium]MCH8942448.1 agmatine deiminase family protein [Bacteroidota bacterium]
MKRNTNKNISTKYRIPAEWEKHEATWIAWPHNRNDWPGKFMPIKWIYAEIVKALISGEKVRIIVQSEKQKFDAKKILKFSHAFSENIEFINFATDRSWLRDISPVYVENIKSKKLEQISFKFNAWAKYDNYKKDERLPGFISKKFNIKNTVAIHQNRKVVLEGGSIDTNGKGILITTKECLLDEKSQIRNKGFSQKDYEEVFCKYLGIKKVIWLNKGIAGDDTHGHVDDICKFVNKNTVVAVDEENPNDENYKPLKENLEILKGEKKLNIVKIPMPKSLYFKNQKLPVSYANFLIANGSVLVPTFNDENDRKALGILSELFPDRKVTGIHAVDLAWGLGTIHCLTKEQPLNK